MEKIELLLSISATALGLFITALTFLVKLIRSARGRAAAENVLEMSEVLLGYIEQAEKLASYSGAEKKEYVITKANQFSIARGINFDAAAASEKIEELVKLTKKVNFKKSEAVSTVTNNYTYTE